jgi:VIT1/CCC1 family predicted Fe2+/Mn2+ transporter
MALDLTPPDLSKEDRQCLLDMQRNEMTEALVYQRLSHMQKDPENAEILRRISSEENVHAHILESITGKRVLPSYGKVARYLLVARFLGLTFGLKRMEQGEEMANAIYSRFQARIPALKKVADDEQHHEQALIGILNDERLSYMGSIVLGLNDALVELTGALAGFTFALSDSRLVAITGLITGLSASMSMAASGYLAARAEKSPDKPPLKAAFYTGTAYVITVILLVLPFFFLHSNVALGVSLGMAFCIIALFNYYLSVACDEPFWKRFGEMAALSGSVALISFLIGLALNRFVPE